jgi:hypothetical protein
MSIRSLYMYLDALNKVFKIPNQLTYHTTYRTIKQSLDAVFNRYPALKRTGLRSQRSGQSVEHNGLNFG